jgi:hypothetical protein
MKGARLLAQVYSITKDEKLIKEAKKTVKFVMDNQNSNGAWSYAKGDARDWIDNFHTGYILDCLDEYMKISGDKEYQVNLNSGIEFYINNFFLDNKIPKYYNNSVYPVDSTAAAQSIITLTRFGYIDMAKQVVLWMIENMMNKNGYVYYQRNRFYTNKIPYMRWSNAWIFLAISFYLYNKFGIENENLV